MWRPRSSGRVHSRRQRTRPADDALLLYGSPWAGRSWLSRLGPSLLLFGAVALAIWSPPGPPVSAISDVERVDRPATQDQRLEPLGHSSREAQIGMPPEIVGLIEKPHLLIAVLLVGAFAGTIVERFLSRMRRQSWRERNRWRWERNRKGADIASGPWLAKADPAPPKQLDAVDQLRIVMAANFTIPTAPEQKRGARLQGTRPYRDQLQSGVAGDGASIVG